MSYAWVAQWIDSTTSPMDLESADNLVLKYSCKGQIDTLYDLAPGESAAKFCQVKNVSSIPVNYNLLWKDVDNLVYPREDIIYSLYLEDLDGSSELLASNRQLPTTNVNAAANLTLEPGESKNVNLYVTYALTGEEQDYEVSLSGYYNIEAIGAKGGGTSGGYGDQLYARPVMYLKYNAKSDSGSGTSSSSYTSLSLLN